MPRWLQVVLAVLVVLLVATGAVLWWRQSLPLPAATLDGGERPIGREPRVLTVKASAPAGGLRRVDVRLLQGGAEKLRRESEVAGDPTRDVAVEIDAVKDGLAEGPVEVQVFVTDDQWRPRPDPAPRLTATLEVDLTPPELAFLSATGHVKHGGAGLAVYRARGASRSGVRVADREFPGTKGLSSDPDVRVALYTIPYDRPRVEPQIFASDEAGNVRAVPAPVNFLDAKFERDRFELKTEFMARKVAELTPAEDTSTPEATLASYLRINRDLRAANEARIREIGASASQAAPLWQGAFAQQPRSKVFAYFPQERDSLVGGEVVDTQWHLGLDLASTERAPIEATNAGEVIFTGDNGIYGTMVVLDHGLGLTSLYAHLSSVSVAVGQRVEKGETVGISGMTGLAGGDHLHYAMMVHGTYTNPIDWFDEGYLHDRIGLPLVQAGISVPGLTDLEAPQRERGPSARKAARAEGRRR